GVWCYLTLGFAREPPGMGLHTLRPPSEGMKPNSAFVVRGIELRRQANRALLRRLITHAIERNATMMKHLTAFLAISSCMLLATVDLVVAAQPTAPNPNRPSETCGTSSAPNFPGNAALSQGSPFNEPGSMGPNSPGGTGGQRYAGSATS